MHFSVFDIMIAHTRYLERVFVIDSEKSVIMRDVSRTVYPGTKNRYDYSTVVYTRILLLPRPRDLRWPMRRARDVHRRLYTLPPPYHNINVIRVLRAFNYPPDIRTRFTRRFESSSS